MPGTIRPFIFSYWNTLLGLLHGRIELERILDFPLKAAVKRAWSCAAWTTLWTLVLLGITHSSWMTNMHPMFKELLWVIIPTLLIVGTLAVYGLLRLYILVSHVIATNIFRKRGQRLRWLNQQTSILSLTFPMCIASMLFQFNHWISLFLICAVTIYAIVLSTITCQLVFHTDKLHGFMFLIKLNIVSWFVTAICLLAFLVALFILSLIAIAFIRLFIR